MKTNRSVIVQCRLSSTRLPGKALKQLGDKPVLAWVLEAMKKVKADSYFVATDDASYEQLKPICDTYNFTCFAGDLNDVLKRFCDLINRYNVKTVIRATADNPFLFYEAAEDTVKLFEEKNKGKNHCDYLTLTGLPHGSGVEVFSAESLLKAASETELPYDHEHVGPALYNHKDKYVCEFVPSEYRYNHPELRTTIDTYSDYLRAVNIVDFFGQEKGPYSCDKIIEACNSVKVKNPVVLMPSVVKGHGTGHLYRCLDVALKNGWFVYIPEDKTLAEADYIINKYIEKGLNKDFIISKLPDNSYSAVIICDTFALNKNQLEEISSAKFVISVDEGSDFSDYSDYLLNVIPSIKENQKVNLTEPDFIQKPKYKHSSKVEVSVDGLKSALVCLGGEDPAGLSVPAAKAIAELYPECKITVVLSETVRKNISDFESYKNVEVSGPIPELKEELYKFDLVITHYGLTAFEAQSAGCKLILLPTTSLHVQLAKKYNFSYVENCTKADFEKVFNSEKFNKPDEIDSEKSNKTDYASYLKKLTNGEKVLCPVCGTADSTPDSVFARNLAKTYRRCNKCSMIYLSWSCEPEKKYEKSYFFDEYQKQYGKTYTEDFETIKKQCLRRLSEIKFLSGSLTNRTVLDIGCAYGPFLSAAIDYKMIPYGTDISDDAVNYVENTLNIPAVVSAFPDFDSANYFGQSQFDIVSMWYVIEHFKNLDAVLRKVSSLVKKDGYFAFSTPSAEGVSGKTNKENFYIQSPSDHYTVWEPSKANAILKKYGFRVVKIVSTGHHPERFPSVKKSGAKPGSAKWDFAMKKSQLLKLGDTVEIYCKKISEN